MKYLVVGGGSMGKRRVRCLLANGVEASRIRVVDPREDRREECLAKYGVAGFTQLADGMQWQPDGVLVCIAGEMATAVCTMALDAGKHVFCEVPMGMSADEVRQLGSLADQQGVVIAPGVQQPFHPLCKQAKQWLHDPSFGKPLHFSLEWCQYMPGWHPHEDLSAFYSPGQLLGVMVLELTQFYEITADRVRSVKCQRHHVSTLNTPGGDVYNIIGDTRNGMSVALHFDLIQRPTRDVARFTSEQGVIEIDYIQETVSRYLAAESQWQSVRVPDGYSYEQCYIDEIGHFLRCVVGEASWHNPIAQAVDIASVIDAIQLDAEQAGHGLEPAVAAC